MTRLFFLPAIFGLATLGLWLSIKYAPGWSTLQVAKNSNITSSSTNSPFDIFKEFESFTQIADKFRIYKEEHFFYICYIFVYLYLYKQTFALPGSFIWNISAGVIFGLWKGFFLVCVLSTIGSTFCYLFSDLFGKEYIMFYFRKRLTYLQQKVEDNSHRLFSFLLFARMFPISPSWLLNIVAPFLEIPLPIFAFSVFVGLAPYNFVCCNAGFILKDLKSWDDVLSKSTLLKLSCFALIPLAYLIFLSRRTKHRVHTIIPTERITKLLMTA